MTCTPWYAGKKSASARTLYQSRMETKADARRSVAKVRAFIDKQKECSNTDQPLERRTLVPMERQHLPLWLSLHNYHFNRPKTFGAVQLPFRRVTNNNAAHTTSTLTSNALTRAAMSRSPSPRSDLDADTAASTVETQLLLLNESISTTIQHNLKFALTSSAPATQSLSPLYERRRQLAADVAHFWLTVLLSHPAFTLLITDDDSRILRSLVHVNVNEYSRAQFDIEFHFGRNAYFTDTCLTKRYTYSERSGRVISNDAPKWLVANPPVCGFCAWLVNDTTDSSDLGELFKQHVYPSAIDLYFGNFSLSDSDDDLVALNTIR